MSAHTGESFRRAGVSPRPRMPEQVPMDSAELVDRHIDYARTLIDSLSAHIGDGQHDEAASGSLLEADDAALSPNRPGAYISHCLGMATDALRTTRSALTAPDGGVQIPVAGHYAPLRSAIEAAASAQWLMKPTDAFVRRQRTLQLHLHDIREDLKLMSELRSTPGTLGISKTALDRQVAALNERKRSIYEVAKTMGVPGETLDKYHGGMTKIMRDIDTWFAPKGVSLLALWRLYSGLAHPSFTRSLMASTLEPLQADDTGPVVSARFTASSPMTLMALQIPIMLMRDAYRQLARYAGKPELAWRYDGVDVPPGWKL